MSIFEVMPMLNFVRVIVNETMVDVRKGGSVELDNIFFDPSIWNRHGVVKILNKIKSESSKRCIRLISDYCLYAMNKVKFGQVVGDLDACMIVLGLSLNGDGSIKKELLERLEVALTRAISFEYRTIILSGGNPKNGIAESQAMYNWLVKNGVNEKIVIMEDMSCDTVQNIQNILPILKGKNFKNIHLVTSEIHSMRALGLLVCALKRSKINNINVCCFGSEKQEEISENVYSKEMFLFWKDVGRVLNIWKYPERAH